VYGALDISVSGMIAQRTRLEAVAANIAGKDAYTIDAEGRWEPFRGRRVMFAPGDPSATTAAGRRLGVHVAQVQISDAPPSLRFDPEHPYAYKDGPRKGYVPISDINPVEEQMNGMLALRAYEANVAAAEASKSMMAQALRLLA
jgi:flagellar basal-body rod protein FlgC